MAERAFAAPYGPLQFAHRQLSGELKIMTWAHFVPDYDKWLDGTYAKQWGEANDVEVKIDHINNALLYSTGAAEVAAQSPWGSRPALAVRDLLLDEFGQSVQEFGGSSLEAIRGYLPQRLREWRGLQRDLDSLQPVACVCPHERSRLQPERGLGCLRPLREVSHTNCS